MARGEKTDKRTARDTPKQRVFVREYLKDLNATQAAIRAGYSEATARSQGQRLLTDADIQAAIQSAMDARSKRAEITADRVLQEIARLAFVDMRKFYREDGSLKVVKDLDDDTAAAIASLETVELFDGSGENRVQVGHIKKLKVWDKSKNLELLGKHLKLFIDKIEHSGVDGGPLVIHHRYGRVAASE